MGLISGRLIHERKKRLGLGIRIYHCFAMRYENDFF